MSPHVVLKLRAAQTACGDLASALLAVAPTAEARIAIARAADEWSAAMARGITAAGQHPLSSRCDVAGCRGCPVCAPERREVAR